MNCEISVCKSSCYVEANVCDVNIKLNYLVTYLLLSFEMLFGMGKTNAIGGG